MHNICAIIIGHEVSYVISRCSLCEAPAACILARLVGLTYTDMQLLITFILRLIG